MSHKNECHHEVVFWKCRIRELVKQYNIFLKNKISYEKIDERIGTDLNIAIKEYDQLNQEYIQFIKENFFNKISK